jgi:hypothetical protein
MNIGFIAQRAADLGKTMIDAGKPLDITITDGDVRNGKASSPSHCAIARAVRRQRPDVENVFVFRSTVWIEEGERLIRYSLPGSLQKEIVCFDRAKKFQPGDYYLGAAPNRSRNKKQKAGKHPQVADRKKRMESRKPKKRSHRTEGIRVAERDL